MTVFAGAERRNGYATITGPLPASLAYAWQSLYKEGAKLQKSVRPALAQSNRNCHLDPPRPHSSLTAVRRSQHNSQSSRTARPDAVLLAGDRIRLGELDLWEALSQRRKGVSQSL